MKKKIKFSKDLCFEFWKKYEEADYLKRDELLKPIIKNFPPITRVKDETMRQHLLKMYLRSYFDDLIDYFYCKENKTRISRKKR